MTSFWHYSRTRTFERRNGGRRANGSALLMDSVITTDKLATVHHSEIDRVIGTFPEAAELDGALRTTLAL